MATNYNPRIVTDGLVLCLDAGNPKSYPSPFTGTTWTDLSGNGNNGTLENGVGYNSSNGGALTFDGSNEYVSLPDNITDLSGDWCISIWMKPNNDSNPRVMTLLTDSDNLQVGYKETTLVPYIRIDDSAISSATSLSSGQFVNVVYQVSNSTRQIYINSILTSIVSGGIGAIGQYSAIGGGRSGYPMNGSIASGVLYNKALTASEIQQNFNVARGRYGV